MNLLLFVTPQHSIPHAHAILQTVVVSGGKCVQGGESGVKCKDEVIYSVEQGRPHGFSEKSNFTARQNFFRSLRESSSLVYADEKLDQTRITLISAPKHRMKRKLNSEDVPEVVMAEGGEEQAATSTKATFASLNLDARLLQAITKEKFTEPTPVQAEAVPLALSGKDILGTSSHFRQPTSSRANNLQLDPRPALARPSPTSSPSSTPSCDERRLQRGQRRPYPR